MNILQKDGGLNKMLLSLKVSIINAYKKRFFGVTVLCKKCFSSYLSLPVKKRVGGAVIGVAICCTGAFFAMSGGKSADDFLNQYGDSALIEAAILGEKEVVGELIQRNIDVNIRDANGYTALMYAAKNGKIAVARMLLNAGADVNAKETPALSTGVTPVLLAAQHGKKRMVKLLADNKADVNYALSEAAHLGDSGAVQLLLKNGANVNTRNRFGVTPLMRAARAGRYIALRCLLENGADVNARDKSGGTALMGASLSGYSHSVGILLQAGADVNACTKNGSTALMHAVQAKHEHLVPILVAAGADVNAVNQAGETAQTMVKSLAMLNLLKGGQRCENLDAIFRDILKSRGEIKDSRALNDKDVEKLLVSVSFYDIDKFKELISKGIDVNAKASHTGVTALMNAAVNGKMEHARLLIQHGADVNIQDAFGQTALMHAVTGRSFEMVQLLLDSGAKSDIKRNDGETALDRAIENKDNEIQCLLTSGKS